MKIVEVKTGDLVPAQYNPRKWPEKEIKDLTASIKEFGLVDPLIVNSAKERKNVVIGGHFRLWIANNLGYKTVPVVYVNIPDLKKEQELNLRLNRNLGQWDWDLLAKFDEELLLDVGFESVEIDRILKGGIEEDDFDAEAEATNIKKPKSKRGEIYQLGVHRLMCGDATNKEDVAKLMDGKKADMVFTDPPYGVDYGAKNRFLNSFQSAGRNLTDIANDALSKDELFEILTKAFTLANEHGENHCSYYVTAPQGGELGLMMMMMMMNSGLLVRHVLIWVKNHANFSLGKLDYEY